MLYGTQNRTEVWDQIGGPWDLIVVGGGITGAGILREGVRMGLNIALFEQGDFASGTSSRSSKLVHGGLRYLNNFQFGLTRQSVCERETLLKQGVGLVEPLPFLYPTYQTDRMPSWMIAFGLYLYGLMGGKWHAHETYDPYELRMLSPGLAGAHLTGGFRFYDAQTDDARLVLRVLREGISARHAGDRFPVAGRAIAINYARVEGLLHDRQGQVSGAIVRDQVGDRIYEVHATVVVNATGAWADRLRQKAGATLRIRPLRGSHLIFPQDRFPIYQAVSFPHPDDGRPVFVFPWEGVTLLGTTDLDHDEDLDREPRISAEEIAYLLRAARDHFPGLGLTEADVTATFAGVRPVISSGKHVDPSRESREHALWNEDGLLTVTGGKLTTFRSIALDALRALRSQLPHMQPVDDRLSALDPTPPVDEPPPGLSCEQALRLAARYGPDVLEFAAQQPQIDRECVPNTSIHWLEFRWAARHECVVHLDDLLLRRVRIGLLVPDGGAAHLPRIRALVQEELGWDDERWQQEETRYLDLRRSHYGSPHDLRLGKAATAI